MYFVVHLNYGRYRCEGIECSRLMGAGSCGNWSDLKENEIEFGLEIRRNFFYIGQLCDQYCQFSCWGNKNLHNCHMLNNITVKN